MNDQGSYPTVLPQPCIRVSDYELEIFTQKGNKEEMQRKIKKRNIEPLVIPSNLLSNEKAFPLGEKICYNRFLMAFPLSTRTTSSTQ